MSRLIKSLATAGAAVLIASCASFSGNPMSFFVTSTGSGRGGDLGGLTGADAQCKAMADSAGAGGKTWRAYLSAPASGSSRVVNARDRIGNGPWVNAKGVVIALNSAELHSTNNISKETALDEKGNRVKVRPEVPNQHDIITGSNMDGTFSTQAADTSCKGWTSSGEGSAIVGHVDRAGINPDPIRNVSWNSSHGTPGCSNEALARVGGGGLFYCFATTN